MRDPSSYQRLVAEIDTATADGQLSSNIRYAEATKLPFLCGVVKEAMRLHPSVGLTMPRLVPAGGAVLAGHHIPAGSCVGVNGAVRPLRQGGLRSRLLRLQSEPLARPRRRRSDGSVHDPLRCWITHLSREECKCLQCSSARTFCIAHTLSKIQISLSELHKLVPQFLRSFTVELVNPDTEWLTTNVWFNKQSGLNVYVRRR